MCDTCKSELRCEWLRKSERKRFTLAPFRLANDLPPGTTQKAHQATPGKGVVLIGGQAEERFLKRAEGSLATVAREAVDLAAVTGEPVLIAHTIALTDESLPMLESIGRVFTAKADPLSPEYLVAWIRRIARRVEVVSEGEVQSMVRKAMQEITLQFYDASGEVIAEALAGYQAALGSPSAELLRVQRIEITRSLQTVLKQVGFATRTLPRIAANIASSFRVPDRVVSAQMTNFHSYYARDAYGNMSASLSKQANAIIQEGINQGLGSREIAREIRNASIEGMRMRNYWDVVASNHVTRARSYSMGSTMEAAGIQRFKIEAVLDDRTTYQCQYLHGKVFLVGDSMNRIRATLTNPDPEFVKDNQPFIRQTGDRLFIRYRDGSEVDVATITDRGTGISPTQTASTAMFSPASSDRELAEAGIGFPPYHFMCRTTALAE